MTPARWRAGAAWAVAVFLASDAATRFLAEWPRGVSIVGAVVAGLFALVLTIRGAHAPAPAAAPPRRLDDSERLERAQAWLHRLHHYAMPHANFPPPISNPVAVTDATVESRIRAKADKFFRAACQDTTVQAWAADVRFADAGDGVRDRISRLAFKLGGWVARIEAANLAREWNGEWPGDDPPPLAPGEVAPPG